MITVYYDGKCGLCSKEISYYKKLANKDKLKWIDLTNDDKEFIGYGYKKSDGLKILHAKDEEDNFYLGIDAFIVIWKNIKYWKLLSYIVSIPIIYQIAKFFYSKFAKWRFNKLEHCKISIKEEK